RLQERNTASKEIGGAVPQRQLPAETRLLDLRGEKEGRAGAMLECRPLLSRARRSARVVDARSVGKNQIHLCKVLVGIEEDLVRVRGAVAERAQSAPQLRPIAATERQRDGVAEEEIGLLEHEQPG